jgi:hypothetical protein
MPSGDQFVVRSSSWQLLKLLAISVGFVLLGMAFVTYPGAFDIVGPGFVTFIGWASIAFFGLGIVIFTAQLIQRKPEFIIDRAGITYPKLSENRIPWSDIADIAESGVIGTQFVTLKLVTPDRLKIGAAKSMMTDLNRTLTGGELSIPLSSADKSLDQVMAAVDRFRPAA